MMNDADLFKSDEKRYFDELVDKEVSKRIMDTHMATSSIRQEVEETPQVKSNDGRTQRIMGNAAMGYQIIDERKEEIRSKRIQIVIKPSVNEKLDEYAADGVIKSKNDLVNQLLEKFIEQQG